MSHFIHNPLWDQFCDDLLNNYRVSPSFEFSKCSMEFGWNIKFKKRSRSLCTVYPRENYFCVMVVIGSREKEIFEAMLSDFCMEIQTVY